MIKPLNVTLHFLQHNMVITHQFVSLLVQYYH